MASSNGGLLGGLNQLVSSGLLGDLGMGLLSASHYGANPGQSMEQALAAGQQRRLAQQQYQMNQYGMDIMKAQAPFIMAALQGAGGQAAPSAPPQGAPQGAPQSAPVAGPFSPRPMPAPQMAAPQQAPQQGEDPWQLIKQGTAIQAVPALAGYGKALVARGTAMLQNDPRFVQQKALATNPIAMDAALLQQAQASGAPSQIAQGLQTKLKTDLGQLHIGSMSGILTRQLPDGSWTTTDPRTGLATNTVSGSTLMPGAAQAQRAMAAAHALGEAAGEVTNVGGVPIPRLQALGQGGSGAAAGSGNSLTDLLRKGTYQKQIGEEGGKQVLSYQEAADAARNANYALDQMMQDAKSVSQGPASGVLEWGLKGIAGVGQVFGVAPPKSLSSYQELDKYANQVAFAATRQMGSREAAQIVHLQMQSNPNKELTAPAFADLAGSMKAMNSYIMAKNVAIQQAAAQSGNPELASAKWTKEIDPRVWDLTLSPEMGQKWASSIGRNKIESAWPFLSPEEQQALVSNIPMALRKQWLASSKP